MHHSPRFRGSMSLWEKEVGCLDAVWTSRQYIKSVTIPPHFAPCFLPPPYPAPFRIMILEGCEVVVKCEGKSMEEYEVTVSEDGKAVACYIASQPGKVSAVQDVNAQ